MKKFCYAVCIVAVLCALMSWAASPDRVEAGEESKLSIERSALDGQDIADLLHLQVWKFRIGLPKDTYTMHVWVEEWTKDAKAPVVHSLVASRGVTDGGALAVKLPTEADHTYSTKHTGGASWTPGEPPKITTTSYATEVLEKETITLDREICLVALVHNENGVEEGDSRHLDDHPEKRNDATVYIKCRFSREPLETHASWRDGKIVFK